MSNLNTTSIDKPKEECGVIGVYNADGSHVAKSLYNGLLALQHRGQESCGIVTNDDAKLYQVRETGLVSEVFGSIDIDSLKGNIGVGHVRYSNCREQREKRSTASITLLQRQCNTCTQRQHHKCI